MTIQLSGHVQATECGGISGHIAVTVQLGASQCEKPFVIYVPKQQAREWTAGNTVMVTMYAHEPKAVS